MRLVLVALLAGLGHRGGAALDAGLVLVALDAGPSSSASCSSASCIEAARRAASGEISPEVSRP
ncbi:hypothetical protein [Polyangium jinanense]|uniref:Uncharacterized protein n=1 Tax=Polyangium jinanense TaxID=2829994 RepID=A0A9X3XAP5_9BACT|nr:hypothetical protein [Polyangium jinanense]MDC3985800.1 hypothetical protein [Polyangium jinanense]